MKQLKQCPQRTLCCPQSGGTGKGKANPTPALGLGAAAGGSYPTFGGAKWGGQFGGHKKSGSGMTKLLPELPGEVLAAPWIRGPGVEPTGRTCHAGVENFGESTLRSLGTASHHLSYGRQWQPLEAFFRQDF